MQIGPVTIGPWDVALVVGVSALATGLAYLHAPRWKALMLCLPIPFTLAALAVGKPIGVQPMAGMVVMLGYTHAVRLLHYGAHVPIVPSIAISAGGYCLIGFGLAQVLPETELAFWIATAVAFAVAFAFYVGLPYREEPGHRSPLPLRIKLPIIVAVVVFLVIIKKWLGGFMTMFPMVGLIAAYEARHSLWTVGRQIPLLMVAITPMMIVCHVTQVQLGWPMGGALVAGWAVYLCLLIPMQRYRWRREGPRPTGDGRRLPRAMDKLVCPCRDDNEKRDTAEQPTDDGMDKQSLSMAPGTGTEASDDE